MSEFSLSEINEKISKSSQFVDELKKGLTQVILGQDELLDKILISLLSNGHILLEGVPGLAKTLTVKTLASLIDTQFQRIQFTPDMLPADLLGTLIYNQKTGEFDTRKGPLFSNIILADEINRSPAKVQSALLEAMQERQVTIGENTFQLDEPFLVMATQNPIEQEGTYPLPEAQADRFLLKINVGYPSKEDELKIVDRFSSEEKEVKLRVLLNKHNLGTMQQHVRQVPIANDIKKRVVDIITATRENKNLIQFGASPRASIGLVLAVKARALLNGRNHVSNEDVNAMAYPILRHRILLNFEAERKGLSTDDAIKHILENVK